MKRRWFIFLFLSFAIGSQATERTRCKTLRPRTCHEAIGCAASACTSQEPLTCIDEPWLAFTPVLTAATKQDKAQLAGALRDYAQRIEQTSVGTSRTLYTVDGTLRVLQTPLQTEIYIANKSSVAAIRHACGLFLPDPTAAKVHKMAERLANLAKRRRDNGLGLPVMLSEPKSVKDALVAQIIQTRSLIRVHSNTKRVKLVWNDSIEVRMATAGRPGESYPDIEVFVLRQTERRLAGSLLHLFSTGLRPDHPIFSVENEILDFQ